MPCPTASQRSSGRRARRRWRRRFCALISGRRLRRLWEVQALQTWPAGRAGPCLRVGVLCCSLPGAGVEHDVRAGRLLRNGGRVFRGFHCLKIPFQGAARACPGGADDVARVVSSRPGRSLRRRLQFSRFSRVGRWRFSVSSCPMSILVAAKNRIYSGGRDGVFGLDSS
jgi:hypothetical protein